MSKEKKSSNHIIKQKSNLPVLFISAGIVLVLMALYFGKNIYFSMRRHPPQRVSELSQRTIEPWMTIRYISRTKEIPLSILESAVQSPGGEFSRMSITGIAKKRNLPVESVITSIRSAIEEYQSLQPTQGK